MRSTESTRADFGISSEHSYSQSQARFQTGDGHFKVTDDQLGGGEDWDGVTVEVHHVVDAQTVEVRDEINSEDDAKDTNVGSVIFKHSTETIGNPDEEIEENILEAVMSEEQDAHDCDYIEGADLDVRCGFVDAAEEDADLPMEALSSWMHAADDTSSVCCETEEGSESEIQSAQAPSSTTKKKRRNNFKFTRKEKMRTHELAKAFDTLRTLLPIHPQDTSREKLSRRDLLDLAIKYIHFLNQVRTMQENNEI